MASAQVGGDYFDVIPLGHDSWGAVVADVAGKGVGSALLACYLQGALSAATLNIDSIERVMSFINRFLAERAGGEKYATLFCCGLGRDGRLRYINAGHCAPLVVTAAGRISSLDATGFPVGLLPDADFPAEERRLEPGDRLVIYSDGVTEARAPGGAFYGTERLISVIGANHGSSCEQLHDAILRDVQEATAGAPQADDVTLLVVEFGG
jgi:sigma-B regulation protein RsbU (phosphoserine phosphatase)